MSCGLEVLPDHLGDDPGSVPDADRRHGRQEVVKRVGLHQCLDLFEDLAPSGPQLSELGRELAQHDPGGVGAGNGHGLLAQCLEDRIGPGLAFAGRVLAQQCRHAALPGPAERGGAGIPLEQGGHRGVLETWADDALERGMDLGEQSPGPVRGRGDLLDEVVVKAAEHAQLCSLLVGQGDRAQSVGQGAGGLSDDRKPMLLPRFDTAHWPANPTLLPRFDNIASYRSRSNVDVPRNSEINCVASQATRLVGLETPPIAGQGAINSTKRVQWKSRG